MIDDGNQKLSQKCYFECAAYYFQVQVFMITLTEIQLFTQFNRKHKKIVIFSKLIKLYVISYILKKNKTSVTILTKKMLKE